MVQSSCYEAFGREDRPLSGVQTHVLARVPVHGNHGEPFPSIKKERGYRTNSQTFPAIKCGHR